MKTLILKFKQPYEFDDDSPQDGYQDHEIGYSERQFSVELLSVTSVEWCVKQAMQCLESGSHTMYGKEYFCKFISLQIVETRDIPIKDLDEKYLE